MHTDNARVLSACIQTSEDRMMGEQAQGSLDWHRAKIRAELEIRGTNLRKLSREAGLNQDTLRNVLDRKCPKYEQMVADVIKVSPAVIWPSRYPQQITD
ncbi:helix-turn-helix domain-containing protein [Yersinia sp. LJYL362]